MKWERYRPQRERHTKAKQRIIRLDRDMTLAFAVWLGANTPARLAREHGISETAARLRMGRAAKKGYLVDADKRVAGSYRRLITYTPAPELAQEWSML